MNKSPDKHARRDDSEAPHLSWKQLLLFVDGELPARDAAAVQTHLESCWLCRARQDRVEQSIAGVVDYRNIILGPYLPPSESGPAIFSALLDQYAEKIGRPSLFSRLAGFFRARMVASHRAAWISAGVAAAVCAFLLVRLHYVPDVSAAELLQRAETSEINTLRADGPGVIYQKLRITTPHKTLDRDLYRDAEGKRHPSASSVSPDISSLAAKLSLAGVNWNAPLSVASFRDWRDQQHFKSDSVRRTAAHQITLTTTVGDGPVSSESLTLREADYRPLKRTIEMRGEGLFEIAEENYALLNWNSVNASLFEPLTSAPAAFVSELAKATPVLPAQPALPSLTQLADTEMAVRFAIHRAGADLGDPIQVAPDAQEKAAAILVNGMVSSDERKQDLLQALSAIPYVNVNLQTEEEAAANVPPVDASLAPAAPQANHTVVASPISEQLAKYCGSQEKVEQFSEQAFTAAEALMAHAAALRQLEQRYSGAQVTGTSAPLSASSRDLLDEMLRDHRDAMREQAQQLSTLLSPLLLTIAGSPESVRRDASLFDTAERAERLTLHLLFGAALPQPSASAAFSARPDVSVSAPASADAHVAAPALPGASLAETNSPSQSVRDLLSALYQLQRQLNTQP